MRILFYSLCLASILRTPFTLLADEKHPTTDFRRHFEVLGPSDDILYQATEIVRLTDDTDAMFMLVRDTGHGDFVMRRIWTFENQAVVTRISDLKDRAYVQTTATMPFQSITRLETLAEAGRDSRQVELPVVIKMETNGGRWDAVETHLKETASLRRLRHDLRQTMDFFLLEAIERMRESFLGVAEGDAYFPMLADYVIYDFDVDDYENAGIKTRDAMPNCSFDQSFGFPCSETQKERVDNALKSATPVPRY